MKNYLPWIVVAILTVLLVLQHNASEYTYRQACYMSDIIRMHMDEGCDTSMSIDIKNYSDIVEEEVDLDYCWCY